LWLKQQCSIDNRLGLSCCDWSGNGLKFAVGTNCHNVFVGFRSELNNWMSIPLGKCKSSVLAVRFHPSGRLLGVCSADHTFKLVTCCQPEFDDKTYAGTFADLADSGRELFNDSLGSWVNDCTFSPAGDTLIVLTQANSVFSFALPSLTLTETEWRGLPLMAAVFAEGGLMVAGYDRKVGLLRG
jgi:actin related protein 2/3 complex subunit 1A/1B